MGIFRSLPERLVDAEALITFKKLLECKLGELEVHIFLTSTDTLG